MNLFLINLLSLLLSCIGLSALNIFSQLPIGPYNIVFKEIGDCSSPRNYKIRHYLYLSRNQKANATYIKGYSNFSVPFDDSLFLEINFSIKDTDGTWKNNTFFHKSPKACTAFKNLMGASWTPMMNGLIGHKNTTCPIPPGIYTASGMDTSLIKDSNFPKAFVYGTYKVLIYYTLKKVMYGCYSFVVEIKPI
ncbi:uncharacterized protein LOC112601174 [Melanaphis sacchari]|uniref:uncharacterized protein LOC112601174 n=1 Tax=Melanaphis sacchari TaxID=742174 RepID=UPI000DC1435D|nr:uncharacterized protein LOC112601174 [Melanaphis sacchari]